MNIVYLKLRRIFRANIRANSVANQAEPAINPVVEVPISMVNNGRYIVLPIGRPASLSYDLIILFGSIGL